MPPWSRIPMLPPLRLETRVPGRNVPHLALRVEWDRFKCCVSRRPPGDACFLREQSTIVGCCGPGRASQDAMDAALESYLYKASTRSVSLLSTLSQDWPAEMGYMTRYQINDQCNNIVFTDATRVMLDHLKQAEKSRKFKLYLINYLETSFSQSRPSHSNKHSESVL